MIDPNLTATTKEISEFLGIPARTLTQWSREGVISQRARGRWHLGETVRAVIAHLRLESPEAGLRGQLLEQQTRIARTKADAAERRYIPAEQVEFLLQEIGGIIKSEGTALAGRLAPEVIGVGEVGEARQIIDQEAKRLLARIVDKLMGFAGELRRRDGRRG